MSIDYFQRILDGEEIEVCIEEEINQRKENAKVLAAKFPEFRGLAFEQLVQRFPIELDFVTMSALHKELSTPPQASGE